MIDLDEKRGLDSMLPATESTQTTARPSNSQLSELTSKVFPLTDTWTARDRRWKSDHKRRPESWAAFEDADPRFAVDAAESSSQVVTLSVSQKPAVGDPLPETCEGDSSMLLQPYTRPVTPEQLVDEVKGIYAGLVMVEKKCVEIITERVSTGGNLSHDQWQALIALHRTLLHEHHDFFLASQHPTASPAFRRLATKYAMPARMWRHSIHNFLELLRQQLPESYDHMLSFEYIAYSMMALLKESDRSFLETWIECLGDLARYRMGTDEVNVRAREIWSNVARTWYNKAADPFPNAGRIQHHLAVLARPNIIKQLFFNSKALVSVVPFVSAQEWKMFLDAWFPGRNNFNTMPKFRPTCTSELSRLSQDINRWLTQWRDTVSSFIGDVLTSGADQRHLWNVFEKDVYAIKLYRKTPDDQTERVPDDPPQRRFKKELRQKKTNVAERPPEDVSWYSSFALVNALPFLHNIEVRHDQRRNSKAGRPKPLVQPSLLGYLAWCTFIVPLVRAVPTDSNTSAAESPQPAGTGSPNLNQELLQLLTIWGWPIILWAVALTWIFQRARKDAVIVYALSALMSGVIAVTFGTNRAAAQFRYPSLGAGLLMQLCYTRALFPKIHGNLPLLTGIVAAGFAGAALLCQLSASSQGVDPDLFVSMLLPSFWLASTFAYGLPNVLHRGARLRLVIRDEESGHQNENDSETHVEDLELAGIVAEDE